jgi:hypothetical protein
VELRDKVALYGSFVQDFEKAFSLGYLKDKDTMDEVYRQFKDTYVNFNTRYEILKAGLLKGVMLLLTSGGKLSRQQKMNLFLRKIRYSAYR